MFTSSGTCESAAQTEQFCACPSTAALWSEDLPTAAKTKIKHINHHHHIKSQFSFHNIFHCYLTHNRRTKITKRPYPQQKLLNVYVWFIYSIFSYTPFYDLFSFTFEQYCSFWKLQGEEISRFYDNLSTKWRRMCTSFICPCLHIY